VAVEGPAVDRRFDSVGQNTTTPELLVRCGCGFEAQGIEEALILIVEEHAIEAHNVQVTDEQVLASLSPAPSLGEDGLRETATSRMR
jgi:predicted small metal-binding protein